MREAAQRLKHPTRYWQFDEFGDIDKDALATASPLVKYCFHQIVGWSEVCETFRAQWGHRWKHHSK